MDYTQPPPPPVLTRLKGEKSLAKKKTISCSYQEANFTHQSKDGAAKKKTLDPTAEVPQEDIILAVSVRFHLQLGQPNSLIA